MIETSILLRLALRRMFFATMPTIIDGGAGDSGGGDDGGGAPADTGGGDDIPEAGDDGHGDDGAVEGGAEETAEPTGDDTADASPKPRTPEQRAKHAEKALNDIKKTDPEGAKILRSEHYELQQMKRDGFPTVDAAREARQTLESVGGPQGIQQLQQRSQDYENELVGMAEGSAESVENLARDYPRGLVKMTPQALDKMAAIDRKAYERTVGKHMALALDKTGFMRAIQRANDFLTYGKPEQTAALLKESLEWLEEIGQFKDIDPVGQDPKDQLSDVERREQALQQKEQTAYHTEVGRTAERTMKSLIARHLGPLAKDRKLNDAQTKRVSANIFNEIAAHFKGNQAYQNTLKAMLSSKKSAAEIDRWNAAEVGRVAQRIVRQVWQESGFATGRPRVRTAAAGATTGPQIVAEKPDASQIDWSKDKDRSRVIAGEATLKDGRVVRWDWRAV
jgi:hypothetical protein